MGKKSQRKGAVGERELAHILRDTYGYDVKRGSVFHGESDMVGLPGIHPEVKRVERFNLYAALTQAEEEAAKRKDGVPTVFHRSNGHRWVVVQYLEDWMDFYGTWNDGELQDTEGNGA